MLVRVGGFTVRVCKDLAEQERFPASRTVTGTGNYTYSLGSRGEPECSVFDAMVNASSLRANTTLGDDECVVIERNAIATSRYELQRFEWPCLSWFLFIEISGYVIRIRLSGERGAESIDASYASWLSRYVGIPVWSHFNANEIRPGLPIREIVRPIASTG